MWFNSADTLSLTISGCCTGSSRSKRVALLCLGREVVRICRGFWDFGKWRRFFFFWLLGSLWNARDLLLLEVSFVSLSLSLWPDPEAFCCTWSCTLSSFSVLVISFSKGAVFGRRVVHWNFGFLFEEPKEGVILLVSQLFCSHYSCIYIIKWIRHGQHFPKSFYCYNRIINESSIVKIIYVLLAPRNLVFFCRSPKFVDNNLLERRWYPVCTLNDPEVL